MTETISTDQFRERISGCISDDAAVAFELAIVCGWTVPDLTSGIPDGATLTEWELDSVRDGCPIVGEANARFADELDAVAENSFVRALGRDAWMDLPVRDRNSFIQGLWEATSPDSIRTILDREQTSA